VTRPRDLAELVELAALGTATIGEVAPGGVAILDAGLRSLAPAAVAGHAYTVQCRPGDNLALHHAIAELERGDMLVVDYGQSCDSGALGEIMALAARIQGAAGLVIDGAVRDSAQIVALGFPVWCRGVAIAGTTKTDRGVRKEDCTVGGETVAQGDIIVADADAVIVLKPDQLARTLVMGRERVTRENELMNRIRAGETTLQVLGLD